MAEMVADVLVRQHNGIEARFNRLGDPLEDRSRVWLDIVKETATHVAVERTFVYSLIKRRHLGPPGLADQLRADYKHMEKLLVRTERRKVNSPDMPDLIQGIHDIFLAHRDRCEALLVPLLADHLSPDEQAALAEQMHGAENVILSHPHPHLLATGPLYRLTTRVASRWDRVRDRTVRNR